MHHRLLPVLALDHDRHLGIRFNRERISSSIGVSSAPERRAFFQHSGSGQIPGSEDEYGKQNDQRQDQNKDGLSAVLQLLTNSLSDERIHHA